MSYANGPRIVTDGLVLCLDAANRKSYPGSGSTWYDLSGNEHNGTMVGTTSQITYNPDNKGYFDADTTQGGTGFSFGTHADFNLGNNGPHSVVSVVKFNVISSYNTILGKSDGINLGSPYTWMHVVREGRLCSYNGSAWYGRGSDSVTNPVSFTTNQWGHVSYCYDGSTLRWYFNGSLINSTSFSYTDYTIHPLYSIASWDNAWHFEGDMAFLSFYNKGLSANEVQQNYNALKGRYGLT
jgi:hypothetical protein